MGATPCTACAAVGTTAFSRLDPPATSRKFVWQIRNYRQHLRAPQLLKIPQARSLQNLWRCSDANSLHLTPSAIDVREQDCALLRDRPAWKSAARRLRDLSMTFQFSIWSNTRTPNDNQVLCRLWLPEPGPQASYTGNDERGAHLSIFGAQPANYS